MFVIGCSTFLGQTSYGTGVNPYSVAVTDVNADNKSDIVVANYNSGNVGVFLNTGSGTFGTNMNYTVGSNPSAAVLVDVNGDNKPDIIAANQGGHTMSVLLHC